MKKIIKLKESDLEKIVTEIVNEINQDETTSVTPSDGNENGRYVVGVDRNGTHYIIDIDTNEVIERK
jgi:hypothetical protein